MAKKPLNDLLGHNDYSMFKQQLSHRKVPLDEIVNDTGDYHLNKCREAFHNIKALCSLTVPEYFTYIPECISRLKELPAFRDCDLSELKVGDVFVMIGKIEDYSEDYTRDDARADACSIMMKPIRDSGYTHPLYQCCFKYIRNAAYEITHYEKCMINPDYFKTYYLKSMNEIMRENFLRDDRELFASFFNDIIIPSIALIKHKDIR